MTQPTTHNGPTVERLASALDEAVAKLEAVHRAKSEPIAVIGVGCRFPGGADGPDAYWRLLREGRDAIGEVPSARWDINAWHDPDPDAAGKMYVRQGGFLAEIAGFDARFFEIAPREAESMDPQQRLLLEVAFEALEHAGVNPAELAGTSVGVFVGATTNDYGNLLVREGAETLDAYFSTGNALNAMPGRLAHILGVQGPCLALDTACSSSLVAVHLACQSLRAGECDAALAGGVNLMLAPEVTASLCRARMLAPDGRCKTFDAAADGYARSEGGGVAVLKRLSDAQAAGDRILALIRGSAVNQDGASGGFTVPNGRAQEALIRKALNNARVEPAAIDYLEAHGTGTALGDPIEVRAAAAALGEHRDPARPVLLGSAKASIGHAEAAAGIAGFIKVVLALHHGWIPPHLHFRTPNPHIPWAELPVKVAAQGQPWPTDGQRPRLAGVSAFGASGTNAHAVLQAAPASPAQPANQPERPVHLLALSAKTEPALRQLAGRYADYLSAHPDAAWADVCHAANTGRAHHAVRAAVVATDGAEAADRLRELAAGGAMAAVADQPAKLAFLFTGQGSQYAGMGRALYDTQPTFRRALDACGAVLRGTLDRPLIDVLFAPANPWLDDTRYTQPALFALEYALAELWRAWGVRPAAVMGHSVGEYAAACVAGVFSVEDGLKLIARRAELMGKLPAGGAMASIAADEARVRVAIQPYKNAVSIAALNAPNQTVISGDGRAVETILATLAVEGISASRLRVSHAFHSPLLDPMLAEFERAAGQIRYQTPAVPFISNLTGAAATAEVASADYWVRHARQPVRFAAGIAALRQRGCDAFLEIGPGRTLLNLGRRSAPDEGVLWLPSLGPDGGDRAPGLTQQRPVRASIPQHERGVVPAVRPEVSKGERQGQHSSWEHILASLGQWYERGGLVDWRGFDRDYRRARPSLPTYPWQREIHWRPSGRHSVGTAGFTAPAALPNPGPSEAAEWLRRLADSGRFSAEELRLAPRLLETLAQCQTAEPRAGLPDQDLLYEIAWRPAEVATPPDYWPTPGELADTLRPRLAEFAPPEADTAYRRTMAQLEALSIDYVAAAWERLGWTFAPGTACPSAELAGRLGVVARHSRLLERTAEMLAEAGWLRRVGERWESAAPYQAGSSGQVQAWLAECPAAKAELVMLDRCGGKLAEVLRGQQDPLPLLFPDNDSITAASLYGDSPSARLMNRAVHEAVALALTRLPTGRGLRVLEIGAGTGGTTAGLVERLPADRADYLFTDISPRFTEAARERFARYPFLRYRALDIERDPAAQGFGEEAPFDLIVAVNVLHATRDIRQTLRHVRRLAAPGALLVLMEGTAPIRAVDLVFGLTDGWWRFAGDELRARHPLLSVAEWRSALAQTGFQATEALALPEESWGLLARQAVIVAAAAAETGTAAALPRWLIFADRDGIGAGLATRHGARGGEAVRVYPGSAFEQLDGSAFQIRPDQAEDFRRLLAALPMGQPCEIIHLWSLDEPALDAAPDPASSRLSCHSVVNLIRALADGPETAPIRRLWLTTRGAVGGCSVGTVPGLAQAGLWGLGRVAAREHPEWRATRVDLDPAAPISEGVDRLWGELSAPSVEDEIAFRAQARHVPRLVRHGGAAGGPVMFRADGTYLITGGLGGLGLLTARWMAERGARQLVLIGRRAPDERAASAIRELEAMGVRVLTRPVDVACYTDMAALWAELADTLPPMRGIVHAAGVLDDGVLRQLTAERFDRVMRPKVAGAWNLHRLSLGAALDFFVIYSSFTGVLGTPGQANHAAANASLDALAWHRRGLGLPALSLDWGAWSEVGAAAERGADERAGAKGGGALSPAQGLRLLERVWHAQPAQLALVPIHWHQLDAAQTARPLFAELAATRPTVGPEATAPRPSDLLERLRTATPQRRRGVLIDHILAETAKVLGLKNAASIGPREGFFALGMDSLTSVELRNRLRAALHCELPSTVAFDHPNPAALADFILTRLAPAPEPIPPTPAPTVPATPTPGPARDWDAADLSRLSVAELENMIDELAGTP